VEIAIADRYGSKRFKDGIVQMKKKNGMNKYNRIKRVRDK